MSRAALYSSWMGHGWAEEHLAQTQAATFKDLFAINRFNNIYNGLILLFFRNVKSATRTFYAPDHILLYQCL